MQHREQELLIRKIDRRKAEIRGYFTSNTAPIDGIVYRETKAYERYDDAVRAPDYQPIHVGDQWGGGCNGWFKVHIDVPKAWKGKQVVAYFDFGGEACAFINGTPYQGIDRNHGEILLTPSAKGGERCDLVIDAASSEPWNPAQSRKVTFARAEIGTRNQEVRDYWYSLHFLHLLAQALPEDDSRRAKIVYTLNKSVDAFDYTHTDEDCLRTSAVRAGAIVRPLLECEASASAGDIATIGHSHLDVAYRWPYRETVRKCSRTFSTVMRLMEQYPEYQFAQSQPQLYEYTRLNYPGLYEEIKRRAKEGRWEVTGSMWVEADSNLPSGESLVRQVLMGKDFFADEFGVETDVLWLPDVFGYSAALPQILCKARVPYFCTAKMNWNQFNHFPYNVFYWKGIDGSRVLSHILPDGDYNGYPNPGMLRGLVRGNSERDRCGWTLMSYGHGDGGGGPEAGHLEFLARARDTEGVPRCHQMKIRDFFENVSKCPDLPEWVGELYLEMHRGTLTTQANNKRWNRRIESLYRDAEFCASVVGLMDLPYPREEFRAQWRRILLNQFHDVIPGSCIRQVVEDTDAMYPEINAAGEAILGSSLAHIVDRIDTGEDDAIVVFNTLSWDRDDVAAVKLPAEGPAAVLDVNGCEVPSQMSDGELRFAASVPSMGYSTYRLIERPPAKFASELKAGRRSLENRFFRLTLDRDGVISSIVEKASGREVLPKGGRANLLQLFEDKPNVYDAWDIDFFYEDKFEDITSLESIEVVERGTLRAAVEITRSFGASKIRQRIVMHAFLPRIDFETWVDWHEDHKCLKVSFPVDVNASAARYEIQFGNIERPTHTNTQWDLARFEVCGHKWADLSDPDFGLSLLNDCKYGHHTKGNVMRLSLLRAPKEPDPEADQGEHVFTYSIMPHSGDYIDAQTVRQAYALNVPLRTVFRDSRKAEIPGPGKLPSEKSFITVDADNVVLETVKRSEKGDGTILRFYECHGRRGDVSVSVDLPFRKIVETDLMEDRIADVQSSNGEFEFEIQPFEIRTFRLM